jgi:predicted patatin/cPLA2 family phospholipase
MISLVLEGGANRTYYTIGILDAMLENNIEVDILVGVSAGIANGISYISKQKGRSLELGMKYMSDKRYMGFRHYFKRNNGSYYNIDFVFKEIPRKLIPFDYEVFQNSKSDVYAVVTNLETGLPEYLKIDDYEKSWQIILASCSLPFMFKAVEIDGRKYMDGGCSDPLPVKFAESLGADKLIAVLTREKSYKKENDRESKFSSFFFRKNKNFANVLKNRSLIYNESKEYLYNKEKEGSAFVFAPKCTTKWKRTEKNTDILMKMYREGYNDAINRMDELKKFIAKTDDNI